MPDTANVAHLLATLRDPGILDSTKIAVWAAFLESHYVDLREIATRFLRRVCGDQSPTQADDVVQETFVTLLAKLNTYDVDRPFRPWAGKAIRNVAVAMWRRERRYRQLSEGETDRKPTPLEELISRELLELMSDEEKTLIQLFYLERRSAREVAEELRCDEARVYRSLHNIRTRLRNQVRKTNKPPTVPS